MKFKTLFLFLFFYMSNSYSQVLNGTITCEGVPVSFANILIKGNKKVFFAKVDGSYVIENLSKGNHEITITAVGYEKYKKKIFVLEGINNFNHSLAKSSYLLDQVVVTGSMRETFLQSSPVKVEVITQKLLKKFSTSNVMDFIDNVNGINKQVNCGVCGTNEININGLKGPYTLVLINGMPIMSSLSSIYGLNGIPTSFIKQIEIVKGPSSTLYGSEAVSGIINIITKKPNDVTLLELDGFYTSHRQRNIDFSFAPKLEKLDFLISGNIYKMQNFLDSNKDGFNDVPLSNRLSIFNSLSLLRKNDKKLNISAKYYKEDRFGGVENWSEDFRGSDSIYGESIYTNRLELLGTYQFPLDENIKVDWSYTYHHQDSYYGDTKYEAWQEIYFANLIWSKKLDFKHRILMGYSSRYESYIDKTLANINSQKFVPGLFLQDEITLNSDWNILTGARLDYHSDHNFIFSPRFNLKWQASTYTNFRFSAGTGFRTVNLFTEEHAALTGAREVYIVDKLQPEESYNINLNINSLVRLRKSAGTFDLDVFYTYFSNKIIPDYQTNQNQIIYDNLNGYSISRGVALNFQQNFESPLSISFGGTFLNVYSVNNNNQKFKELFVPDFAAVFSVSYLLDFWRTSIDWTGNITGPMYLPKYNRSYNRSEKSNWFSLQNLKISKKINNQLQVYVGIKNILNYTQETPLINPENPFGDDFDTSYVYGPLQVRRYFFGINQKF